MENSQPQKRSSYLKNIIKIVLLIVFIYFINNSGIVNFLKNGEDSKDSKTLFEKFTDVNTIKSMMPFSKMPYKLHIPDELPTYKLGLDNPNTFLDVISKQFKKHIFPVEISYTGGSYENIKKIESGELDLAIVDENMALDYQSPYPIKYSTICVCYSKFFIFVTLSTTNINSFNDIMNFKEPRRLRIGVINPESTDYYQLVKILQIANIDIDNNVDIIYYNDYLQMGAFLKEKKVDLIYLSTLQKNFNIHLITNNLKCIFITPKLDKRKIRLIDFKQQLLSYLSYEPFGYIDIKPTKNRGTNQRIEYILNRNNKILYYERDEIGLIDHLKLLESVYNTKPQFYLSKHCIKFSTLEELYYYLFEQLKTSGSNQNFIYYVYLAHHINSRNRATHIQYLKQIAERLRVSGLTKSRHKILNLYQDGTFNRLINRQYFDIKKDFEQLDDSFKAEFNNIQNSILEINTYPSNLNTNNFIETYSSRDILICRRDLPKKHVDFLLHNLIKERDSINNRYYYYLEAKNYYGESATNDLLTELELSKIKVNLSLKNNDSLFKVNEMASVKDLPIHPGTHNIYEKLGFIKRFETTTTNID